MRTFKVEEPICKSYSNNAVADEMLHQLHKKLLDGDVIFTGSNASSTAGQESYVELLGKSVELDPYAPYIQLDQNFKTPLKYVKNELAWYKSEDLSIIGHEGIESNPTWNACCTKDEKKEINSNYGWCVFSEANGSQYDSCLSVLKKDDTSRNAIIVYQRPEIYRDYKRDGMHDMICTFYSHFFIRNDKLYMIHRMRSNDIKFGFICSDLAWNCFVYQNMLEDLKETYPELEPAKILWCSDSMHLYSRHYDALRAYCQNASNMRKQAFDL